MAAYEIIIIGAGPAGLFAALGLENPGAGKILLVEQGPDLAERHRDTPGGLLCGWGGAGASSGFHATVGWTGRFLSASSGVATLGGTSAGLGSMERRKHAEARSILRLHLL